MHVHGRADASEGPKQPLEAHFTKSRWQLVPTLGSELTAPRLLHAALQTNTPEKVYGRKCVVFAVTKNAGAAARERAKFIGSVSLHPDGVVTADDHLREYYGIVNDN
jgi:hypothetical protein